MMCAFCDKALATAVAVCRCGAERTRLPACAECFEKWVRVGECVECADDWEDWCDGAD